VRRSLKDLAHASEWDDLTAATLASLGEPRRRVPIAPDGNCQFRSLLHALGLNQEDHGEIRSQVVDYIQLQVDRFQPFLEDASTVAEAVTYLSTPGSFGNTTSLHAMAELFSVQITLVGAGSVHTITPLTHGVGPIRQAVLVHKWPLHYDSTEPAQPAAPATREPSVEIDRPLPPTPPAEQGLQANSVAPPLSPQGQGPDPGPRLPPKPSHTMPRRVAAKTKAKPAPGKSKRATAPTTGQKAVVPQDWKLTKGLQALEDARARKRLQRFEDHNARVPHANSHFIQSTGKHSTKCVHCNKLFARGMQWRALDQECSKWEPPPEPPAGPPPSPKAPRRKVPPEIQAKVEEKLREIHARKWKNRIVQHNAAASELGKHHLEEAGAGGLKCNLCDREWTKKGIECGFKLLCPHRTPLNPSTGKPWVMTTADRLRAAARNSQSSQPSEEGPPAKKPRVEAPRAEDSEPQPPPKKKPRSSA
jgi:hypothetical protein